MGWIAIDRTEGHSLSLRLFGACLLTLPIGFEREASERTMGLRTFPLVAFSSAVYVVPARRLFGPDPNTQARVLAGLVTGIGFIGAAAILKLRGKDSVHGTAAAAGVWTTGAIGAAVAQGESLIATLLSGVTCATFRWMTRLEDAVERRADPDGTER